MVPRGRIKRPSSHNVLNPTLWVQRQPLPLLVIDVEGNNVKIRVILFSYYTKIFTCMANGYV